VRKKNRLPKSLAGRVSGFMLRPERLESRRLLSVSRLTDTTGSPGYLPALDVNSAAVVDSFPSALFVTPEAMTTPPSGDNRIEALRSGYKWGTSSLTYSFYAGGNYYSSRVSNPSPVSEALKANVRHILTNIFSPVINMTFVEVPDTPTSYGVMRFTGTPSAGYAAAYYPTAGDTNTGSAIDIVGDVIFNPANDVVGTDINTRNNSFQSGPGSHGFSAIVHEIGHALGLKHPFDPDSSPGSSVTLATADDNQDNTVMTYTFKGQSPATLMPYDLLALQYFYGANAATRSGDTTYAFTAVDNFSPGSGSAGAPTAPFDRMRQMLWDGGGTDTLDLSAVTAAASGYRIDIQPGGWITANSAYRTVTYSGSNLATDYGTRIPLSGTIIENVIVTGSSDSIFLNSAANRISGYTPGVATGADVINGSSQADTLDLTKFLESEVAKSQVGNDLVLNLGGATGTITIKDYYASPSDRITILYKSGGGGGATLSIAAAAAEKPEGNSGPTAFIFTVTRAGDLTGSSSTSWAVTGSGANAANAADFMGGTFPTGSVSFAANQSTATITVNVAGDTVAEPNEGFTVTLSSPSGATLGTPAMASGTITDDDSTPPPPGTITISVAGATVTEGNSGTTQATLTLTLSSAASSAVTVQYATTNGTATTADNDYTSADGTVTFTAGETQKTITITVNGDTKVELDEIFTVNFSNPVGATLANPSATVTITNDDASTPPGSRSLSVNDVTVIEGNAGTTIAEFTVLLSAAAPTPVTVWFKTADATATTADRDYLATTGSLTFLPGETSKPVRVAVSGDVKAEANESFALVLSSPRNATIARGRGTATIANDDTARITASIGDASIREGNSGERVISFVVTLSAAPRDPVTMTVRTVDGTATSGADYTPLSRTITFGRGMVKQTVSVWVRGDTAFESDET